MVDEFDMDAELARKSDAAFEADLDRLRAHFGVGRLEDEDRNPRESNDD
jgi:hypothetical protein